MPVRIYDISKKLGMENKQVLARAKELGITAARVASSQLDKISGEYLEEHLRANPPMPAAANGPQQDPAAPQPSGQLPKPAALTITCTNTEIQALLGRVLAGEIPLVIEVSREDGSPPVRARLVPDDQLGAQRAALTPALKPRPEPIPRAQLDEHTKRIFLGAYYYASTGSKDGWVNLAEYGSTLKKQDPTFQPQDFGERSLGGLVRRMTDLFDIKADANTPPVYYIRLKPSVPTVLTQPHIAPTPSALPTHHARGRVHNLKLGFGFIAPDDGTENIFFHATEVVGCTIFDLRPGDPVEYESGVNERGPCAYKVRRRAIDPQVTVEFIPR